MGNGSGKISIYIQGIIAVTAMAGVVIAVMAYIEYRKMNKAYINLNVVSTIQTLDSWETKFLDMIYNDDDMNALWAYFPDNNITVKERADKQLKLLIKNKRGFKYEWKHVNDLETILFEEKAFYDPTKVKLRKCYNVAERLLYLISSVHIAWSYNMIDNSMWGIYKSYIYDIGTHPLFLATISYGHDIGFYKKEFANELRNIYMGNKKLKTVMQEIYPNMIDNNWVESTGSIRSE